MVEWWQDAVVFAAVIGAVLGLIALRRAQRKRDHGCGGECACPKPGRRATQRRG